MNTPSSAVLPVLFAALMAMAFTAQGLPLVDYANVKELYSSDTEVNDYRLMLSDLKKVNSRWRAEREQRLGGQLRRKTLELGEDDSAEEVFNYYRRQLLQLGGRELFHCRSRNCGSSNAWANTRFHVKQLYGLDGDQYYSAFEVIEEEGSRTYVALYAVRRGNNRNYLQLDVLTTRETPRISSSPDAIVERLEAGQAFSFIDALQDDGGLDAGHLESLVKVMKRKRSWVVGLVGHNYSVRSLAEQRQQSLQMVAAVKQQLVDAGVDADRIEVFGLGGLVPGVRLGQRESLFQVVLISR